MARQPVGEPDVRVQWVRASALKLKLPLNVEVRAAGLVVCSTNIPVFNEWAPLTLVTLPETLNRVL